jgi:uncharacterized protein (DUF1697 family)
MARWVALLRGINVGGKNVIRMEDLRACVEAVGHTNVATYIQSGNVVFDAKAKDAAAVERGLEAALAREFRYSASVMVRSLAQVKSVVEDAPRGFGKSPARFRYDVIFLKEPPSAEELLPRIPQREGVDRVWAGEGVLYFSRAEKQASKSRLSKITAMPIYQRMTIRNWNTTTKLLALLEE